MSIQSKLSELLRGQILKKGVRVYLVRHGQSLANHAGSVVGWTDSKLSIKGRQQANKLFRALHPFVDKFTAIHSSDLSRCKDTLDLSLGFPSRKIHFTEALRQLNFGEEQGIHFDSLKQEDKKRINSLSYSAPGGQNWTQARRRAIQYLSTLNEGHHLVYTHGGLTCSLTHHLGIKQVIPNCSVVAAEICPQKKDLSEIAFRWNFDEANL